MFNRFLLASVVAMAVSTSGFAADPPKALSFTMNSLDGKPVDLSKYDGKAILVVNVASKCGNTPQYAGLQAMYEKYKDKGFVILGIPCNQFGGQEPGNAKEISTFCTDKYHVTFDMFEKIDVKGDGAHPFYKYLTAQDAKPKGAGTVGWNFEKFLIDKKGQVVGRFGDKVKPDDKEFVAAVESAIGK